MLSSRPRSPPPRRGEVEGHMYGLLLERDVRTHPWQEIAVDLMSPWDVEIKNN